ncbi:uncharacterized protein LOC143909084 [Arctopsyche grandis]|uniref:uncharacterized protein LOC143909084 n=1 Tax=Arctopsyche grandis TaxID=121162 RepID=UPI00406D8FD3
MDSTKSAPTDLQERLFHFARSFVAELEGILTHHYDILEGNIENSGKFIEILSEIPIVPGIKTKALLKPLEKPMQVVYKNKSLEFYNLVYDFKKSEERARRDFVKIAFDVFKCFELQFSGITSTRGLPKAMQRLGKDAAHRYINSFIRDQEDSLSNEKNIVNKTKDYFKPHLPTSKPEFEKKSERVFHGKSKSKKIAGIISIHKKLVKPGYDIQYICQFCKKSHDDWNTANLYDEVGIISKSADSEDFIAHVKDKSNHKKYGFRRSLSKEIISGYKQLGKYIMTENCKETCMCPKFFKPAEFGEEHYDMIVRKIDADDDKAVRNRISKSVDTLHNELADDIEILSNLIESNGDRAFEMFLSAQNDRDNKADDNRESHADLKMKVTEVSEKVTEVSEKLDNFKQELTDQRNKKPRVLFRLKKPVKYFTGRDAEFNKIHEALNQRKTTIISQTASIVGLGGIGKTELSKMYAQKHDKYYLNIIFIDSEKQDTILESIKELARNLKIDLKDEKEKERDMKVVVENIYGMFNETGKTLIIFDNVEKYNDIKRFIFDDVAENNFIYTLINSRRQDWEVGGKGDIEVIRLNIFTDEEAMNFLEVSLMNESKEDLKTLTKLLENFPLGLKQAVGYIQQQNRKKRKIRNFTVNDYLLLYREQKEKLLNEGFSDTDDIYNRTVMTTWTITLKNIEENEDCGKMAIRMFEIMGYLSPDNIRIEDIFKSLAKDVNEIWDAVELLELYSMISIDVSRIANIHRLVQEVTRVKLREKNREEVVLKLVLTLLQESQLEEHVVSIWEHSSNSSELVKDFFYKYKYGGQRDTPLHLLASCRNDTVAISKILNHLGNISLLESVNAALETPLYKATRSGNLIVIRYLVELGANIYTTGRSYQTPLHLAVANGHEDIARYLISRDSKMVDLRNFNNETPLDRAISEGHLNMVEILVPMNNDYQMFHARLNNATKSNDPEKFMEVIKNVNENNHDLLSTKFKGETALHLACCSFDKQVVKCLIDRKICLNQFNSRGLSPLHFAMQRGDIEMLNLLLDNGADIQLRNKDGKTSLHFAFFNVEILKMLLEQGFNPNEPDNNGDTPFIDAVRWGNTDVVKLMLNYKADPHVRNKKGDTSLTLAAKHDKTETLKILLECGVDVNHINMESETALHIIFNYQRKEAFDLLLKSGADPTIASKKMSSFNDKKAASVIHEIVIFDDIEKFKLLLENGINLNIRSADDSSLLHYAVVFRNIKILPLLLDENIDLNITDMYGQTAVIYAMKNDNFEAVELLLAKGADPNICDNNGNTLLHYAAATHQLRLFEFIFKRITNPLIKNRNNETVLHWAVQGGNNQILQRLLDEGFDLNATDDDGDTPLLCAAMSGHLFKIMVLLSKGADPKIMNYYGDTLLHCAAYKCCNMALEVIMGLGFDLTSVDNDGKSPLHSAVIGGNISAVKFFIEKGIEPNITDINHRSPLHDVVLIEDSFTSNIDIEIAKLLIQHGANINAADKSGCTPLHFAADANKYKLTKMLLEEGAEINARDNGSQTALHKMKNASADLIDMLMNSGPDQINIFDVYGKSPLYYLANAKYEIILLISKFGDVKLNKEGHTFFHLAVANYEYRVVENIIQKFVKIDLNVRDNGGRTPLHLAAARGRVGIVALLVKKGADISAKDKCGNMPLQSAMEQNRIKIVKFLEKAHRGEIALA